MNDVYLRVSEEDYRRLLKLVEKDDYHRTYVREKWARQKGRALTECKVKRIELHLHNPDE